jgi:hypothetical protein
MALMYRDFVRNLSARVEAELSTIAVGHNFELGPEFEIALCNVLASYLPTRFGVARGYVVSRSGEVAGDDIVVFERARFPTIAGRGRNEYLRKEFVPIEAAYAYIEAKHSIYLGGEGPQSLRHAVEQVSRVKALVSAREAVPFGQLAPYARAGAGLTASGPEYFPSLQNPFFGIVQARHVRLQTGGPVVSDAQEIHAALSGLSIAPPVAPDHLALGRSNIVIPVVPDPADASNLILRSPFFIPSRSIYTARVVPDLAFGISLVSLLQALDWIQLGVMPWHPIVVNALGIPNGAAADAV